MEHRLMAFNFLSNQLNTYLLNRTNKKSEFQIINQTAQENNYHPNNTAFRIKKPNKNTSHKTQDIPLNSLENKKWAVFTYAGKETRHITKLFKNTNIKPAFKTKNTLKKTFVSQTENNRYIQ
jgi:hypothetical protein